MKKLSSGIVVIFTPKEFVRFEGYSSKIQEMLLTLAEQGADCPGADTFLGKCLTAYTEPDAQIFVRIQ